MIYLLLRIIESRIKDIRLVKVKEKNTNTYHRENGSEHREHPNSAAAYSLFVAFLFLAAFAHATIFLTNLVASIGVRIGA